VLDADIRGFFDTIDHGWMQQFVQHRIEDHRLLRLIGKWLKAGVMEANQWQPSKKARRRERLSRPCWPTCTCIIRSTCGQAVAATPRPERGHHRAVCGRLHFGLSAPQGCGALHEALRERLAKFSLHLHGEKTR
jgi:RNA-directed DNA polymerase